MIAEHTIVRTVRQLTEPEYGDSIPLGTEATIVDIYGRHGYEIEIATPAGPFTLATGPNDVEPVENTKGDQTR